jgi:hypothetical protein
VNRIALKLSLNELFPLEIYETAGGINRNEADDGFIAHVETLRAADDFAFSGKF